MYNSWCYRLTFDMYKWYVSNSEGNYCFNSQINKNIKFTDYFHDF